MTPGFGHYDEEKAMPLVELSDTSAAIPLPAIPVVLQLSAITALESLSNPDYTQIDLIVRPRSPS